MGGWGMPGVGMGMGFERPIEENVVNNYYDSPGSNQGGEHHFQESNAGNDGGQLADASWTENSGTGFDDSSSNYDDSGSFDDSGGGSGDDSGGF